MRFHSVPIGPYIQALANELKKHLSMPEWAFFVKTGHGKERPPQQADWFFVRAAAILRTIAMHGPIGTQKLRLKYGNRKNKGYKPEHFAKAGGSVIREILQQLDKAGFTKAELKAQRKGRIVTPQGQSLMDKVAKPFVMESRLHQPKQKEESAEKVE